MNLMTFVLIAAYAFVGCNVFFVDQNASNLVLVSDIAKHTYLEACGLDKRNVINVLIRNLDSGLSKCLTIVHFRRLDFLEVRLRNVVHKHFICFACLDMRRRSRSQKIRLPDYAGNK